MVTSNPLQLSNLPQVFPVPGGISGSAQLLIQFDTAPSAGTVTVERRAPGVTAWSPLVKGTAKSITSGALGLRVDGPVGSIRVTFTGLVGGTAPLLWVDTSPTPYNLYNGSAAITIQPYTEANVKNGLEFYVHMAWPTADTIANGVAGAKKFRFQTGAKPVIFKGRVFDFVSEEMTLQIFEAPTGVSGGTPVVVRNFNTVNPVATTVTITKDVTATGNGTPIDDPEYFFGSTNAPSRQSASIPVGRERILKANTTYLIVIISVVGTSRAQYSGDWYEGELDFPL